MDQGKGFCEVVGKKRSLFRLLKHWLKKTLKFAFFLKELIHAFCEKIEIFPNFLFYQNG